MVAQTSGIKEKFAQVPEKEAWLYRNENAFSKVRQGSAEARRGEFSKSTPDIEASLKWLEDVDDDQNQWIDC